MNMEAFLPVALAEVYRLAFGPQAEARGWQRQPFFIRIPPDDQDNDLMQALINSFNNVSNRRDDTVEIDVQPRHLRHRKRCMVCLEQITTTQLAVHLKCRHYYHKDCIAEWGKHKASCPVCRAEIPVKHPKSPSGGSSE